MEAIADVGADRDDRSAGGRALSLVSLIIPTRGAAGKSRLVAPAGVEHAALARALASDTIAAALGCRGVGRVVLVTDDDVVAAGLPARVIRLADPGSGLGAAVLAGLAVARITAAPYDVVGVLLGDLPALRAQDLDLALRALGAACLHGGDGGDGGDGSGGAEGGGPPSAAFVPDHRGSGTVLLVGSADRLRPEFGEGSAGRHSRWARRLDLAVPRLQRDVDDAADLAAAIALGVGPATRAALSLPRDLDSR